VALAVALLAGAVQSAAVRLLQPKERSAGRDGLT
jgi:hypothetical protein